MDVVFFLFFKPLPQNFSHHYNIAKKIVQQPHHENKWENHCSNETLIVS